MLIFERFVKEKFLGAVFVTESERFYVSPVLLMYSCVKPKSRKQKHERHVLMLS